MTCIGVFCVFFAICLAVSTGNSCYPKDAVGENRRKLSTANNELGLNLYRKLVSGTSRNVFFSPLSISTIFGMLFYGVKGETAKELRKALGYEKAGLLNDLVHDTFNRYFSDVLESGDSSNGYVLNSANSILVDKSVEPLEEYWHNVQVFYKAAVRNVDFSNEASKIVEEINDWVKQKTNGKIDKLFDKLSPATILVLLNAVYFKGTWENQFNPKMTRDGVFFNNGWEAKRVPMMHMETELSMAIFEDFKVIELPYKGGNVSMLIFLPDKLNGLQGLEDILTLKRLKRMRERMYRFNVDLFLPKFKLEFVEELSESLKALGANRIFSPEADFSGMTLTGGVSVSKVLHKAAIEVNEEGTEAAAVTSIIMFKSATIPLMVDHPFLFAIVEKSIKSNMILFLGRVNNL